MTIEAMEIMPDPCTCLLPSIPAMRWLRWLTTSKGLGVDTCVPNLGNFGPEFERSGRAVTMRVQPARCAELTFPKYIESQKRK